ncbi:hypothetical protein D6774_03660 [Candidatus Woesearchaeota archaeon]|nr:MAG: hypothetical protein D6774_03660 [Candidatus Woesearchaeota archaeon]
MKIFRRRLYKRGSSMETTIPAPLLFECDPAKKYDVLFEFDREKKRWYIRFEERPKKGEKQ